MIYLDTSCLLKLFRPESSSAQVSAAIAAESRVIISALAELEALIQLKAAWMAGEFTRPKWRRLEAELGLLRNRPPFEFRSLSASVFPTALRQHRSSGELYCRTLDQLHLSAMEESGITRLMTHDHAQAAAAEALGFEVIQPGRTAK